MLVPYELLRRDSLDVQSIDTILTSDSNLSMFDVAINAVLYGLVARSSGFKTGIQYGVPARLFVRRYPID